MTPSIYSPHQQTRQQLEELDSLLQRMLSLPVNPATASAPVPAATPEAFAPSPPTQTLPARSAASDATVQSWRVQNPMQEPTILPFSNPQPPLATPVEPLPEPRFFATSAAAPAPAMAASPLPYTMVFGPQTTAAGMPAANVLPPMYAPGMGIPAPQWEAPKTAALDRPPLPMSLWPIYLINRIFDLLTLPLGPLGSWLRQSSGRNVMGWMGVLMILAAIGWAVADWYGLDWTR